MTEVHRNNLEWARDIAFAYRAALRAVDPDRCRELDLMARQRGQMWIAPLMMSSDAMDESFDQKLPAVQIERLWGVKASTIRSWARAGRRDPHDPSKPLLRQYKGENGPLYIPREVLAVRARHRIVDQPASAAAGQ